MMSFAIIIPTLNAIDELPTLFASITAQTNQPRRIIIIDSSSNDGTVDVSREFGPEVYIVAKSEFNHGGTRMKGVRIAFMDCDVAIFLTQDAILHDKTSLAQLLEVFEDENTGSAYGRQLPHENAGPLETYARLANYPEISARHTSADIPEIGFKTCFCSNSFSAFRIAPLQQVGGFPEDTIFGEDALAVGELLLAGYAHCYVAKYTVRHSHAYTLQEEFRRYFDIGVMHARNSQLIERFGSPSGAGTTYVLGELRYLAQHSLLSVPEAMLRTFLKYIAYKIGRRESMLSVNWKRRLSMHKRYWTAES